MGKILILSNHSYMLYKTRLDLLKALAGQHEIVISVPYVGHEEDFRSEGFGCIETAVDRRRVDPLSDLRLFLTYCKLLKQEKPDLIIAYSIKPNIYGGIASRLRGIPFCANVQGLGTAFQKPCLSWFATGLYRTALKNAHAVFFENAHNAQEFLNRRIVPQKKEQILPGAGVDLERYHYCRYPENAVFRFLYLGRIMEEKGVKELFGAVQKLREEGYVFEMDLVGFFEDVCQEKAMQLQEEGILRFRGFQKDPIPYYAEADCVVLPSYHEGMSNVLLEAAAIGRPVIASDIPGCREAVTHGVTGLLCTARSTDSLYDAMKRMLFLSRQERADMGKAGRCKMEREFDKKQVVAETIHALPLPHNHKKMMR